ncbi:MAG: hypothetical protein QOK05_710 [Chloroflexota bacterium]|jgi:hypothetical protein|nr:hypothetical protein [Chloroflexota bacterium]
MNGRRSRAIRRGLAVALTAKPGALGLAIAAPRIAEAAIVTVPCNDIPALTTAITDANTTPGTISLAAGCTYILTTANNGDDGLPTITNTVTIEGNGATITRQSEAKFRILHLSDTANATIQHLTVSNGAVTTSGTGGGGGGIYNEGGTLDLVSSTVSGNAVGGTSFTAKGGGILSVGTTSITDSVVTGNAVTIDNAGNTSPGVFASGGGIAAKGGTLRIRNSTISKNDITITGSGTNSSGSGSGGGIASQGNVTPSATSMDTTITGSTISENTVTVTTTGTGTGSAQGGGFAQANLSGLSDLSGTVTGKIINSTFSGNTTATTPAGSDIGGAISMGSQSNDTLAVINSTVAGNSATKGGGVTKNGLGAFTLVNTILASNTGLNCDGTITDSGHNISFPATDTTCVNTFGTGDPKLGSLADNGGLTKTMALGTGSAAIDTADNAVCQSTGASGAAGIDQRGMTRVETTADTTCDIGAFEVQPVVVIPSPSPTASAAPVGLPTAGHSDPGGGGVPWPLAIPAAGIAVAGIALRRRRQPQ